MGKTFQRNLYSSCIKEMWTGYFENGILRFLFHYVFVLSKQTSYYPEWKTQFGTVNLVFFVIILLKFDYMIFSKWVCVSKTSHSSKQYGLRINSQPDFYISCLEMFCLCKKWLRNELFPSSITHHLSVYNVYWNYS